MYKIDSSLFALLVKQNCWNNLWNHRTKL